MSKPKVLSRSLILVLLFWVTGGQWLVLQSVAWGGMIHRFSQADNLEAALSKTFDGDHLCGLCRFIQKQTSAADHRGPKALSKNVKNGLYFVVFASLWVVLLSLGNIGFVRNACLNWRPETLSPPPKPV
ncbi:MAG: hypothetical protein ACREL1_05555 [bacterium]